MGQQQLLLVILVTIIVGIATVVAINTFGSAADSANVDAVRQDLTSMAASAQGYYMKPGAMGGGGNLFTDITFENMGGVACDVGPTSKECNNENGDYKITATSADQFTITGTPAQAEGSIDIVVTKDGATMGDYTAASS